MTRRAFAQEDADLGTNSVPISRKRDYKDIDLTLAVKPTSGDFYSKTNAAAVKQSIKNILLTSTSEKPFQPQFGGNLGTALFELDTDYQPEVIVEQISTTIHRYEPRARVLDIAFTTYPDRNEIRATITFEILNVGEVVSLDVNLARLR